MTAKVAIIIPAYNAENGLERSVQSVLNQTLKEIEVWIVDDGSCDSTGCIADKLSENDARVHVIHQDNCGCYQARLRALKQIKTPYFGFIDADDIIESDMYEKMVFFAEAKQLDVVRCSYDGVPDLGKCEPSNKVLASREDVLSEYVVPALIEGTRGGTFVWNKLYRNQYDFNSFDPTDRDTTFEDMIFNLQFFLSVQRMGFIDEPLYHYKINDGSSVRNFTSKTLHDFKECMRIRKLIIPQYGISARITKPMMRKWLRLNSRNAIISALRSKLPIRDKISNVASISKIFMEENLWISKSM